jgi:hypothetical protein
MGSSTIPEVFIIESLTIEDEQRGRTEGEIISRMLKLSGKKETKYFYIRTERELDEIVDIFDESDYRYLHLSCHASKSGMTTTFDPIPYKKLGEMLAPCISKRRVFGSACEMANDKLADALLFDTECYSVLGPARSIGFDDAAAFWVAFYHLMFKANENSMKHKDTEFYAKRLAELFAERINYFRRDLQMLRGYRKLELGKDVELAACSGSVSS